MNIRTINLGDYLIDGEYDFSSRTRGIAVRAKSNVGQLIEIADRVEIIIPAEVYTMSKSFWREFLGNSILDQKEKFLDKVHFISEGRYQPKRDIEEIVKEMLKLVHK